MNTSAYLQNQGWRGLGYSLDQSNRGLAKPLLVSQKADHAGLGLKKHDFENQWWLAAFDKSLKEFGTQKQNSATAVASPAIPERQGLYSSFVKAETLASTIAVGNRQTTEPQAEQRISEDISMARTFENTGVPLGEALEAVGQSQEARPKRKKESKRKHSLDNDVAAPDEKGRSKRTKKNASDTNGIDHSADFISLPPDDRLDETSNHQSQAGGSKSKKKAKKETAKEIRERKKVERRKKTLEGAKRNREKKRALEEEAIANGTYVAPPEPMPDPARQLWGSPHPESIMALRAKGEEVSLAGDRTDENHLRYMLINAIEDGREKNLNSMLKRAYPTVDPNDPAQNGGVVPEKKISYKQEKYKREKTKREAKREAKLWVDIRANTHLYRPDGSYISPQDRGVPIDEVRAKRLADKELKKLANAEKAAKRQLKEEMKVERRVARKRIRAEKKMKNHIEMQAHISAKIQRQKREKDEADAAAAGMSYEAFIEKRESDKVEQKRLRDEEQARTEGITYEELLEKRRQEHDAREMAAEAKKQGLTLEEYANQKADFTDEEVGLDNPRGAASGMGQHHGRSPIDSLWEKHQSRIMEQNESDSEMDSSDSDSNSDSDASSEPSGSSSDDSKGGVSLAEAASNHTTSAATKTSRADGAVAGDNFIPLDPASIETDTSQLYIVDTAGDSSKAIDPNAPKRVKDMTRTERKARLEAIRAKRAERNAALGITKMSKKERRKNRAQRKEQILNRMTNDLLKKKREQERAKAVERGETVSQDSKSGENPAASKQERKQVRREARRIMRGMKKGTIPEAQILPQWQLRGKGNKKPKLRGNGGRDPPRPGSEEANRKTRWQWKGDL